MKSNIALIVQLYINPDNNKMKSWINKKLNDGLDRKIMKENF